ncbi:hypothetical protein E4T56_gene12090 [Termitomyces sp. T112]|nr:hypothetical protein E4T56_gene12090 [Termitomyces sp. T112]
MGSSQTNKGTVAGVFPIVGLIVVGIIIALTITTIGRRRVEQFNHEVEVAAESAAASPPNFLDYDPYRHATVYTNHLVVYTNHLVVYTNHLVVYTNHLVVYTNHLVVYTNHLVVYTNHLLRPFITSNVLPALP